MRTTFEDAHPGRPRILFVGIPESSHTHSWIELLDGASFNVRLFGMPTGLPPNDWPVPTYVTSYDHQLVENTTRTCLYPASRISRFVKRQTARILKEANSGELASRWLAATIMSWRPHLIHTLGLDQARFYFGARRRHRFGNTGKWVLQLRGGSDLALAHRDPELAKLISEVIRECDQLLSDNQENFRIALEMGIRPEQLSRIGTVPGTGGIDLELRASLRPVTPSTRRTLLLPKSYETPWQKILPVFEALKLCWDQIQPCEVWMLAADPEARMWFWDLPSHIREHVHQFERLPRSRALEMMSQARVMLAPSLVDGVPAVMYEAMVLGAFPIVSPLETIVQVVEHERNVLFARNLYPEEIAAALRRAMTDDGLVDAAAARNLELVRRVAGREEIRSRVINFYEKLVVS